MLKIQLNSDWWSFVKPQWVDSKLYWPGCRKKLKRGLSDDDNSRMLEIIYPILIILVILAALVRIYQIILIARVISSFIVMFNPAILSSRIYAFLYNITEPPLNFLRNILPSRIGFFDLSVLWLFLILELLSMAIAKTVSILWLEVGGITGMEEVLRFLK